MKKQRRTMLAIFLGVALCLQSLSGVSFSVQAETSTEDSTRIVATITPADRNSDQTPKTSYWTGEVMNVYSSLDVSGIDVNLVNPYNIVTIPRAHLNLASYEKPSYKGRNTYQIGGFTFSAAASIRDYEVYSDDENIYVRYNYDQLKGGMRVDIPITMSYFNGTTPNGTTTVLTNTLYQEDGSVYTSDSVTLTGKAVSNYRVDKFTNDDYKHAEQWVTVDSLDQKTTPEEPEKVPHVNYVIRLKAVNDASVNKPHNVGDYYPKTIKVIDRLPEGAFYNKDGYTSNFKYDETLGALVYESQAHMSSHYTGAEMKVYLSATYPGVEFGKEFVNQAEVILDEGLESEQRGEWLKSSSSVTFRANTRQRGRYLHSGKWANTINYEVRVAEEELNEAPTEKNKVTYTLYVTNYGSTAENNEDYAVKIKEMKDFGLNKSGYPESAEFFRKDLMDFLTYTITHVPDEESFNKGEAPHQLIGVTKDGEEQVLARNLKVNEPFQIPQTSRFVDLILRFDEHFTLNPGKTLQASVETMPNTEVWLSEKKNVLDKNYYNWMAIKGHWEDQTEDETLETSYAYFKYRLADTGLNLWSQRKTSDQVRIFDRIQLEAINYIDGRFVEVTNGEAKNVKTLVLLPEGYDYVPKAEGDERSGAEQFDYSHNPYRRYETAPIEPTVIPNWKNTGRVALLFDLGHVGTPHTENGNRSPLGQGDEDYYYYNYREHARGMSLWAEVSKYAQEGTSTFDFYTYWSNNKGGTKARVNTYVDALDLDGDGDTTENFLHHKQTVFYLPPRELRVKKSTSVDGKIFLINAPTADLGSEVWYRIDVDNQSPASFKHFYLLDEFPALGDKTIVENQQGEYPPRRSDFAMTLAGPITVPEAFLVYYSLEGQTPTSTTQDAINATWLSEEEVNDFAQVKRLKFVLKEGRSLEAGAKHHFDFKMRLPKDKTIEAFTKFARNSVAFSTNGVQFLEANTTSLPIVKYQVEGLLFHDLAKDGVLVSSDKGRAGHVVSLYNADGSPATDLEGKAYQTLTDAEGRYHFEVYQRGQYYVQFEKTADELWTVAKLETAKRGQDATLEVTSELRRTELFELTPDQNKIVRDAGVYDQSTNLVLRKVAAHQPDLALEGAVFALYQDGRELRRETSDQAGYLAFRNLPAGTYQYKEVQAPAGYHLNERLIEVTLEAGDYVENLSIQNEPVRGSIHLKKMDAELSDLPVKGAVFELRQRDESGLEDDVVVARQRTNEQGELSFENVPFGRYLVVETEAPSDYVLDKTEHVVEISKQLEDEGKTVELELSNRFRGTTIRMEKRDGMTNQLLPNVRLALYQGEVKVREGVTNASGELSFERVPLGRYELHELEEREGYNKPDGSIRRIELTEENLGQVYDVGTIYNYPITALLALKKVDGETDEALAGVGFAIKKGEEVVYEGVTDEDGNFYLYPILYGDYVVEETAPLEGYQRITPIPVQIREREEYVFEVKNYKVTPSPTSTPTPSAEPTVEPSPSAVPSATPTPMPSPSPTTAPIPKTGEANAVGGLASLLLVAGVGIIVLKRRRISSREN